MIKMSARVQSTCSSGLFGGPASLALGIWDLRMSASLLMEEDAGGISRTSDHVGNGEWIVPACVGEGTV